MATLGMYTADLQDTTAGSNEQARTGTYSFKSSSGIGTSFTFPLPNPGTIYGRIACYFTTFLESMFKFSDGVYTHCFISITPYTLSVYRSSTSYPVGNSVASPFIRSNTWMVFEFKVVIHDTAGEMVVKLNGDTLFTATNFDSKNSTNAYATKCDIAQTGATVGYYDDIVFDDANWPGLGGIEVLRPTADGADTDWTGSYADVDEAAPDDDTTYISTDATVTGTRHTFTFGSLVSGATAVPRVGLAARAKLDAAGSGSLNLRLNGNQPTGDGLSTSYQKFTKFWDVDPADSNAWSQAKVNAIEAGVSS